MQQTKRQGLNYRRTLLVGFAFFLICAFWQAYDSIIPKILTDKFGLSQFWSGIIMALDNMLALFLLPFFGALSDKSKSKRGRRTPFVLIGTVLAVVCFLSLSFFDQMQLTSLGVVGNEGEVSAMEAIYDAESTSELKTPDGESYVLRDKYTKEEFTRLTVGSEEYTDYAVPARQSYAWKATVQSPTTLLFFILLLLGVLISMGIFRSPAVALMPDVTPKPLRSKANAVINLMGSVGGVLVIVLGIVFKTGDAKNALMPYGGFFLAVAAVMIVSLVIFLFTVNEPKWAEEAAAADGDADDDDEMAADGGRKLSSAELRSLILILFSVALWYMGYNAVISKYSVYAGKVLALDYNTTLLLAQVAAVISYLPIGFLSSRFGRKKMILVGVLILTVAFGGAIFVRAGASLLFVNVLFALAGIGWATINVNSYPMVVELARGGDVGKYTGFYYTASMAAQVITPVLSGFFLDIRFTSLFPYATIFVFASFITMLFVRHGDVKPQMNDVIMDALSDND